MQFSPEHNYSSVVEPPREGQAKHRNGALDLTPDEDSTTQRRFNYAKEGRTEYENQYEIYCPVDVCFVHGA